MRERLLSALVASAFFVGGVCQSGAAVSVTGANGGGSLSADTAANSPSPGWTTLGAITITEGDSDDFGPETNVTLVLKAPAGFEFNTNVVPDATATLGTDVTSAGAVVSDPATITLTLTVSDVSTADVLTIGSGTGIQIRPTAGSPLVGGKHIYRPSAGGGSAAVAGVAESADGSDGSDFGALAEIAGAPATVAAETAADGSGTRIPTQNVTAGTSVTAYAVDRDGFGNFVANVAAEPGGWTLTNASGGVASGDLVAAGDAKSAVFTGHRVGGANIAVAAGALAGAESELLTVVPAAADRLVIGTAPSAIATAGAAFAQQPVVLIEDPYGNVRSNDTLVVTASRGAGAGILQGTTEVTAFGGVAAFNDLAHLYATNITISFTSGSLTGAESGSITVNPGVFAKLQLLLPGEESAPATASGKTGVAAAQSTDHALVVRVNAVDNYWNLAASAADVVSIATSDATAVLPPDAALSSGTQSFNVKFSAAGSHTVIASDITDGSKSPGTSPSVNVTAGLFAKLQILLPGESAAPGTATGRTGSPSGQTAGSVFQVTVRAVDVSWNVIDTNDVVQLSASDSQAVLPASAELSGGTGTFSLALKSSGSQTVTVTDITNSGIAPAVSDVLKVSAAAASKLVLGTPPSSSATAGAVFVQQPVILIADEYGNVRSNDTVVVTATRSAGAGTLLGITNVAAAGGAATFSDLAHTYATNIAISFSSGSLTGIESDPITINPGAFTRLQLLVPGEESAPTSALGKTGEPTAQNTDTAFAVRVNAVDDYWNRVTEITDTASITSSDASAVLPADAALSGGTQSFNAKFGTAGSHTLTVSDITDGGKSPGTSPSVTVTAGAYAKLQILLPGETPAPGTATGKTGSPNAQTAGSAFQVTVRAADSSWNLIGTNDVVQLSSSDSQAVLPGSAALSGGIGTFSVVLKSSGDQAVSAIDLTQAGISPATSDSLLISAAAATKLVLGTQPSTTAIAGVALAQQPVILIEDDYGNVRSNDMLVVTAARNGGAGTLQGTTNVTAVSGIAIFSDLAHIYATNITISFSSGILSGTESDTITVNPAAYSQLLVLLPGESGAPATPTGRIGSPAPQTAGSAFAAEIRAADAYWNPVDTITNLVGLGSSDATAILTTNSLVNGTNTLSATFREPGSKSVTAYDLDDGQTSGTSSALSVSVGSFARLQLLLPGETAAPGTLTGKTGTPAPQTAGAAYNVAVNAVDSNWNPVSTNDTVTFTSTDPNFDLPAGTALVGGSATISVTNPTAGAWTITVADGSNPGIAADTSPQVTVNPGPVTRLQLLVPGETAVPGSFVGKTGTPAAQNTDSAFAVTVNAVDANWNLVNTMTDTVGITSSEPNAALPANAGLSAGTQTFSFRFNAAGDWNLTATDITDSGKAHDSSPAISVNPGAFTKLQLLMPGETAAPGTLAGKTGSPGPQTAGNPFSVTIRAVDDHWNLVDTNDTVHVTSSDTQASLSADAALNAGTGSFAVTLNSAGSQTVTASDVTQTGISSSVSEATAVSPAAASRLVIAMQPSATAIAGAPFAQQPVVRIEDPYGNLRSNDTLVVTASLSLGTGSLLGTASVAAAGGVAVFTDLAYAVATEITIEFSSSALLPATSTTVAVSAGSALSQLLVLLPGELAAPGTPSGKTGTPVVQAAGTPVPVIVSAIDSYGNVITAVTDVVSVAASDSSAVLPPEAALVNGSRSFNVTFKTAGTQSLSVNDVTDGQTSGTSPALTINPGPVTKLQLLLPGETAVPGTATGKTGQPIDQMVGTAFGIIVKAVDENWNVVNSSDTIHLASSDASAVLPADASLVGGSLDLNVSFGTAGNFTITASDIAHPETAASISPAVSVWSVQPVSQTQPVVGIHDSELTRALESLSATSPTPAGAGTTGFEWWPTNWHYFVMPESVKETLRSDGTSYEVVSDQDIGAGRLLADNGQPRCPILISLASEAVSDNEIAAMTNYVAAGGTLLVGSSAFTRNANGTSRGDFALASAMGVHMVNPNLVNWANSGSFTKTLNHGLISHIPAGTLAWQMPSAAEEIPWGTSPAHAVAGPQLVWRVQPSDAVVIARGDAGSPYLMVKQYGKGTFIYCAALQPLMGHGGNAPGMYAYGILRHAIEAAFASCKLPITKLSPWPYEYNAAFAVRHDLENFQPLISAIESSARYESTNGVKGDYYFCTGALRVELTNSPSVIAGLRHAVSDYGAMIGSHNGGLQNPVNPSLVLSNYDYWHWGPDEALGVVPPGYASGKEYALNSISNSFVDIDGWLSGLTNGLRAFVGCYFNASREDSYDIEDQLGVKTAGEQKLGPFPHWTISTRTPGKRYQTVTLPVSDWFVGSQVAQAMESGHTISSVHDTVDFYYGLGGLINLYSHSLSDGSGQVGGLLQEYIRYGLGKPRVWSTNALGVYTWWTQRSQVHVTPTHTTNGNQGVARLAISGATDSRTAVEVTIPQPSFYGLEVFTNGIAASSGYRVSGQMVKLSVGTSVTNAEVRYFLTPIAQDDFYTIAQGMPLAAPAPGVLSNDVAGLSESLSAVLVTGPAQGTLALNPDGSFNYVATNGFSGVDTFQYQATDGTTNSAMATVTILVTPGQDLFSDSFTRPDGAESLLPWQVSSGTWAITNGMMRGGSALQTYGYAYVTDSWTDYWVQARVRLPAGAYGGGLGGRLNPATGAHYAAWIYPEGSIGGSAVLKLFKFQNWTTFGYNNSSYVPMQQISLSGVGTNWHTLKLAFHSNRIAVYLDGQQVMSETDIEAQPYLSGGLSLDLWTFDTAYAMTVDDVVANHLVLSDNYSVSENTPLAVAAPGTLANDTAVYGTNLLASITRAPTNGTVALNPSGGFEYTPATNFAGADSFVYQASDGATDLGSATVNITVNPAIIVTADSQTRTYGNTNAPLTGSIVGLQSGDNITASFSTSAEPNSPVGAYPITITLVDPDHNLSKYSVATNNGTVTVNPAALAVTGDNAARAYGANNPVFTGMVTGIQNGDDIAATFASTATAASSIGDYPIVPTLADPNGKLGNYVVASTNGALSITPAALTVVANNASRAYGATNPAFSGTLTGVQNGDNITVSYATAGTVTSFAGTYPITPSLVDPSGKLANYTVSSTNGTLTVTVAALTVAANDASRAYGATNPVFSGTLTGVQNGDDISATYLTTATVSNPVGMYAITPTLVDPAGMLSNYTVTSTNGTLRVTLAALTVTASNASRTYGATNPVFNGTLTGVQNGDNISATYASIATATSLVGDYPITPTLVDPSGAVSNYTVFTTNGTLSVAPAALTVAANGASRVYGATNPLFSGTLIGLQNSDDVTATFASAATVASPVGDYPVTPTLVDPDSKLSNYSVSSTNGNLVINPALLTATADAKSRFYGAVNPIFTATYGGFVNGEDAGIVIGALSGSTAATTNSPVGTYSITVGGQSAPNYTLQYVDGTLTVLPTPLLVAANNTNRAYGQTNPVFSASLSGWVNGEDINSLSGALSLSSSAETNSPAGAYPIIATGLASTNYTLSYSNGTLTVAAYALSVTASNQDRAYGSANPLLTGSLAGVQNGDNISAVYTTTADTNSPVGGYVITPTLVDPNSKLGNYAVAITNGTLTVTLAALAVTASDASRVYGATNPVFNGTLTGVQNGDDITATYASAATASSPVGNYPITPTVADPSGKLRNYSVSSTNGTLTINPALLTGTADAKSRLYGATNPVFTATYSGFVNGQDASIVTGTLSGSTPATTNSPVGTYPITVGGQSAPNYTMQYGDGTLTVVATPLLVTANNTNRAYGHTNPVFSASIIGWANGEDITSLGGALAFSSPATTNSPVGTYPIIAAGLGSTNYTLSYSNGTLTVAAYALSVTASNQSRMYGSANPALTGSLVGVQNGDNISAVYTTAANTNRPVGSYAIIASLLDPDHKLSNYAVATNNATLIVTPAALTVTADPKTKTYGDVDPALTYQITGGGLVNGDVLSGTLSRAAGENAGAYAIQQGTVAANTNYTLTYVGTNLTITPRWLVATADDQMREYGDPNPAFTISYAGFVGTDNVTNLTEAPHASTTAVPSSPVENYDIVLSGGSATNYQLVPMNGMLTVLPAELTVVVSNATRVYGAINPVFSGTMTGIKNGDNITATYGTPATQTSPVGHYTIFPTLNDPTGKLGNYSWGTGSANGTLVINPALLTGTADAKSRLYGATNPVFTATYSGFVNGQNGSIVTGTLSGSTTATTNSPVGTYLITVSGQSAPNYTLQYVGGALTVLPTPLLVTANNTNRAYGHTNPVFSASISGWANGEDITSLGGALAFSSPATTNSPVGTYPIVAAGLASTNYTLSYSNGTLTVAAYALSVTASNQSRTYGSANPILTGSLVGVQNGDNISAVYTTAANTNSAVGNYAIIASLLDPDHKLSNYAVATNNATLTVTPAALTVTADPKTKTYGGVDPVLTYQITSGGLVNGDVLSGTLSRVAGENAGAYAIQQGTVAANTNYTLTYVGTNLTITPRWLVATADDQMREYGDPNPAFTISYAGFVGTDNVTNLTEAPHASTTAVPSSPVENYDIVLSGGSATNYQLVPMNGMLTVLPAELTVVVSNATRVYGAINPVFSGTMTGIKNGDNITATYGTPATQTSPVGHYTIFPTLNDPTGKLGNYSWGTGSANGTLVINPALLTGTADAKSRLYGATNPVFTATYSGFVNGQNGSIVTGTLSGSTTATTNSPVGTYLITVGGQSAPNYTLQYVGGALTVLPTPLLVTANNTDRAYGHTNPVFSASISGWVNGEDITSLGGTLALSSPATTNSPVGTYPIIAAGLASTNYTLSYSNGTLTVGAYALSVTASNQSRTYGSANPVLTGSLVGVQNGDNISAVYTTTAGTNSAVGTYAITPTLSDPGSKLSNYTVATTNGTLTVNSAALTVTANNNFRGYGGANPVCRGTISGVRNGDSITASYVPTATTTSPVGNYLIMPSLADPGSKLGNYTVTTNTGTLAVNPVPLTVTAANASRPYGMPNPAFTGTINGLKNSDNITASYATAATSTSPAGTYNIVPNLIDPDHKLANYTVTSNNGTLTVTAQTAPVIQSIVPAGGGTLVITWTSVSNGVYRVQYKTSLPGTNWISATSDVVATNSTASFTDHPAGASQRYYRILYVSSAPSIAPVIQSITGASTPNVLLTWSAVSNRVYRVQYSTNLAGTNWINLAPDTTATNSTASYTDHPGSAALRYYRISLLSN